MSRISKLPRSLPPTALLPEGRDPRLTAPQAPPPSRRDNFIDRPTGLRPGEVKPNPNFPHIPSVRRRSAEVAVTVKASTEPNLEVRDNSKVTSTLRIDEEISVDKLGLDLDIPHTWKGDLQVTLTSPSGKSVVVHDRAGGSGDDVKGRFDLSAFAGESAKGEWTLTVEDKASRDTGTLKAWGLEITGEKKGEPKPAVGEPIVVVLDGGVDVKHSDLSKAMWTNTGEVAGDGKDNDGNGIVDDLHGFNVGLGTGDVFKGGGTDHGTHVAGIIAADDNGVGNTGFAAGKAKVMSIGGLYDGADLLTNFERAVDYMVFMKKERGANIRVVNASFGDSYSDPKLVERWEKAIQKLADADILLAAATANGNGSDMDDEPDMPANVDRPNVITVAAMDRNNDKLARFSSHGDKVVEIAAVGEDVLSTVPNGKHQKMSGTSMATPTVAAAAALMFAANPDLTAAEARQILMETAQVDSDLNGKIKGSKKLDIAAAVARATELAQERARAWF